MSILINTITISNIQFGEFMIILCFQLINDQIKKYIITGLEKLTQLSYTLSKRISRDVMGSQTDYIDFKANNDINWNSNSSNINSNNRNSNGFHPVTITNNKHVLNKQIRT